MTWTRMPLFVWSMRAVLRGSSWPSFRCVGAGLTLLLLDRGISFGPWEVHKRFFSSARGRLGASIEHAFWFLGHPEICVIALPVIGIISEVLPVFARKPIFGYKAIVAAMTATVASTAAIVFLSMIVWASRGVLGRPAGIAAVSCPSSQSTRRRGPVRDHRLQLAGDALARQRPLRLGDAVRARLPGRSSSPA